MELISGRGDPVIDVCDLRARQGTRDVLRGIDFRVQAGELFALFGPRGAGKSTLLGLLSGTLTPTAGRVRVSGRVATVAASLVDPLSTIARARDAGAEVLLLDEPSAGWTAAVRAGIWAALAQARAARGLTTVIATGDSRVAERCDRVALLDRGRLLTVGCPRALTDPLDDDLVEACTDHPAALATILAERHGVTSTRTASGLVFRAPPGSDLVTALLTDDGIPGREIVVRRPVLDDLFQALTDRHLRLVGSG